MLYNEISMQLPPCLLVLLSIGALRASPVDVIVGKEFEGRYTVTQPGRTFDYLDSREGRVVCIFYGQPNRQAVNSVELVLLDPEYDDGKGVLVDVRDIVQVNESTAEWSNASHTLYYTTLWKERQQKDSQLDDVSSLIAFEGLETEDYAQVKVRIEMQGKGFAFTAELSYYDQVVSTMAYSLYVSGVIGVQVYSAFMLLRVMEGPNLAFAGRLSLLTLSLCNIEDFSSTMEHIQYIMSSESGYLFFILPALAYIVLFIIFDMKMLFLVWRSHNIANIENPQLLRKKLTAFYIQFYLGLFLYLTLTYFFGNQFWLIVLRYLALVPQVVHNVRLGQKPTFNLFYLLGYIGSRLLIPLYQRLCPHNRFHLSPNLPLVVVLLAIFALEMVLLGLQHRLGSRFFVPKRFLPNYYNYKQRVRAEGDLLDYECTICLQRLFDEPHQPEEQLNKSGLEESLVTRGGGEEVTVMNTPCNHKFHEDCLAQWMEVKLECPTCRARLPPLQ